MTNRAMDPTIKDFESAIAELETIVKTLEEGDLALEKSLELFERGVQLSRFCHSKLEEAERRVEILNERGEVEAGAGGARRRRRRERQAAVTRRIGRSTRTWLEARRQARRGGAGPLRPCPGARRRPPRSRRRRRGDALQPARRRQAAAADARARRRRSRRRTARASRAADARGWRCRPRARSSSFTPTRSSTTTCRRWTTTRCAAAGRPLTSSSARAWRSSPATRC